MVLGAAEHGCSGADAKDAETWRRAEDLHFGRRPVKPLVARYLRWLRDETGYTPAAIENEVIHAAWPDDEKSAPEVAVNATTPGSLPGAADADVAPPAEAVDTGQGTGDGPVAMTEIDDGVFVPGRVLAGHDDQGRLCVLTGIEGEDPADHATHGHEYDPDTQEEPGGDAEDVEDAEATAAEVAAAD
jgi:hypothetical protein